jgi:hypothetical protein
MPLLMNAVVRNWMKRTPSFFDVRAHELRCPDVNESDQDWIGRYAFEEKEEIWFASSTMHVRERRGYKRVQYTDILGYDLPPKHEPKGVDVHVSGSKYFVPISGSYGGEVRYWDAWLLVGIVNIVSRANARTRDVPDRRDRSKPW